MATVGKNFANQATPSIIDTEYERCTFLHDQPIDVGGAVYEGVRIFPGDDTPRTFIDCNLINAKPPPGSTLTQCNTSVIQRSIPDFTESVTIDGYVITLQRYKDVRHGRYNGATEAYDYLPSPVEKTLPP